MSEDWKPGDLAVCIKEWPASIAVGMIAGKIYRVASVALGRPTYADEGCLGLFLEGLVFPSPSGAVRASNFRKVQPPANEPCEAEFVTLLKRTRKQVRA